ncbi:MAG TPA: fumarylacetoacetate hydrolase family protein [Novosphingobium sp.]|nr:fumarylacetoacetate hydrolase family protein [Novosphingobium sp.]
MKLLRFGEAGQECPGVLDGEGRIRDLSSVVDDIAGEVLSAEGLAALRALDLSALPLADEGVRLGACVGRIGKFVCIGLNYIDHARESGMEPPAEPVVFNKWTSAVVGPNDDVVQPRGSDRLDWEVELGVVIGKAASYVSETEALDHVAGYCVINDVSERSFQFDRGGTWDKGKGCDTFGPTGPWLVTADEVPGIASARLWLEVDGERHQDGTTADMIFTVPQIIAHLSQFMTLQPGDVISTGTPAGVGLGLKPPRYLRPGNEIRLGIEGLGEQRQRVVGPR